MAVVALKILDEGQKHFNQSQICFDQARKMLDEILKQVAEPQNDVMWNTSSAGVKPVSPLTLSIQRTSKISEEIQLIEEIKDLHQSTTTKNNLLYLENHITNNDKVWLNKEDLPEIALHYLQESSCTFQGINNAAQLIEEMTYGKDELGNQIKVPRNFEESLSCPQAHHCWQRSKENEYSGLKDKGTWKLVPRTTGVPILGNKWVFRIKTTVNGTIEKYKSRLVILGYNQIYGVNSYNET